MTLEPERSQENEVGLATDDGGGITIMGVAKTSRSVAGGMVAVEETGETVDVATDAMVADQELEVIGGYRVHALGGSLEMGKRLGVGPGREAAGRRGVRRASYRRPEPGSRAGGTPPPGPTTSCLTWWWGPGSPASA